ncbi:unnamed protein product, partial [Ectocarpus sp. 12 AP-2014]
MIELGVDVNGADWSGFTPLHWTSDKITVDLLIDAGANIEAQEVGGSTPLNCTHELDEICALVNHGADFKTQDKDGHTPLHNAVHDPEDPYSIHADIVEKVDLLLKTGADETVVDNEGKTAVQRLDAALLHGYILYDGEDDNLARTARKLLANAPAHRTDSRWRRRALLVLCIAHHRRE